MTALEMHDAIGKPVMYDGNGLEFLCMVKDVKTGWGKPRFLIVPMAGKGEKWVEFSSIKPVSQGNLQATANSAPKALTPGVTSCMIVKR